MGTATTASKEMMSFKFKPPCHVRKSHKDKGKLGGGEDEERRLKVNPRAIWLDKKKKFIKNHHSRNPSGTA